MENKRSLYELLKFTFENKASDLHLKVGKLCAIRIDGEINLLPDFKFNKYDFEKIVEVLLTPEQQKIFKEKNEIDLSYALEGVCRFRVNLYRDLNGSGAVFRVIPHKIMTFDEIGLPVAARKLIEQPERKKGKWMPITKGERGYSAGDFRCDQCGTPNPCYRLTSFCPNCGADMRGEQE